MLLLLVWSSQQSPYREQLQMTLSPSCCDDTLGARWGEVGSFSPLCRLTFLSDFISDCNDVVVRLRTAGWTGAALGAETQSCSGSAADVSSPHKSPGLQVQVSESQQG